MSDLQCPKCGKTVAELTTMDAAIADKIRAAGKETNIPSKVCSDCFTLLAGSVARGSVLIARERALEQKKITLWKSRVNLIKNARLCMGKIAYAEAAVQYEKYVRVLEMVFDAKPGELAPDHFKDSARTQELTVVAMAFWDLLRIYDTGAEYTERQALAAMKLAQFLRFTPIYPEIMKKAEAFQKTARNPAVIKTLLKMASENKGKCFIATSAFGSDTAPEVLILQSFRDRVLFPSPAGRLFVDVYYQVSPPIAWLLDRFPVLKPAVRFALKRIADRARRH